jgi:hypothetical protein
MRPAVLFLAFLTACSGDGQSFSSSSGGGEPAEANGILEVYPADGVVFDTMPITSSGQMEAFRITNIGQSKLIVTHVQITDAGDNVGIEVFKDLRRADGGDSTAFDLKAGEKVEFTLNAQLNQVAEAVGNIEIYTNDTSVDMGGPGKFMLPLLASAVDPNAGSDTGDVGSDTGDVSDDTGTTSEDSDDTGVESAE